MNQMELDHFAFQVQTIRKLKEKVMQESKALTLNTIALNKEKLDYIRELNAAQETSYQLIKRFKEVINDNWMRIQYEDKKAMALLEESLMNNIKLIKSLQNETRISTNVNNEELSFGQYNDDKEKERERDQEYHHYSCEGKLPRSGDDKDKNHHRNKQHMRYADRLRKANKKTISIPYKANSYKRTKYNNTEGLKTKTSKSIEYDKRYSFADQ